MHVLHGDYLSFEVPSNWTIDENDETTSIYDNKGEGAITMSFHTVTNIQNPLDEHISIMAKQFIDKNQILLHNSLILDTTKGNKLVLYGTGMTIDNWFIKIWLVANSANIIFVTYLSQEKTSEVKKVDKIIDSFQFAI